MSTKTIDALGERTASAVGGTPGEDRYRFLATALPNLVARPDDHHLRLMAVRAYLELSLVLPAKELLEFNVGGQGAPAEFDTIRSQLASLPAAPIPWSQRARRFERNLTALTGRGVDVKPIRESWAAHCDRYELFRDRNGLDQVRMGDGGGRLLWIPYLDDHRAAAEAQPLPDDIKSLQPGPYLFEGIDLGWFFERVYQATRDTFLGYGCALFVVEPDPSALAVVLHLRDWMKLLADQRVFVFVGDSCADQLCRVLEADPDLPWPRQAYTLSLFRPGCSPSSVEIVQTATGNREREIAESFAEVEFRYASRDIRYWAKRFDEALSGRGAPLRILASVSTHTTFLQYSVRDAQRAFESLGHECVVLTERNSFTSVGPLTYHKGIRELDPDVFFILDHVRPEFEGIIPKNLPVLTWDQDQLPHVFTESNMRGIARHDFLTGYSKYKFVTSGFDPDQFLYARVPTCPDQFSGEPLTDAERQRYGCDVSYVSHASQTPEQFHQEERARYQEPKIVALLDTMYEMMPGMLTEHRVPGAHVTNTILDEASRRCGVEVGNPELRDRLLWWYLWRLGDRLFRHEGLEWVAKWARRTGRSFRIYGNGWDKHATLSEFAAGAAENGRELLCVYRASRINLQLMPAGFIHQRALDGLAAGGFFLTRTIPSEMRGKTLRRLDDRIGELGLTCSRQVVESDDAMLKTLLEECRGEWLKRLEPDSPELYWGTRIAAEQPQTVEVFTRFGEIVFDSEGEWAAAAERFLGDEDLRREVADEMRQVVVDRFSYRAEMDRFLRAMAAYLKKASA